MSISRGEAGAGEEEMGAETSSMEPKVTADAVSEDGEREMEKRKDVPCLTGGTLLRAMLASSFMGTPWPGALGRREWVRWGRGDCAGGGERGVVAALF